MKSGFPKLAITVAMLAIGAGLTVSTASAGGKAQTFSGQVSDAACGTKHTMMPGDDAACTRACVRQGAKYVLVVGDKVYTLDAKDKAALDELDKLAGQQAKVTGQANGDSIAVSSVGPAK
jgi:uridylate kinase